jgi:hypothetical protein
MNKKGRKVTKKHGRKVRRMKAKRKAMRALARPKAEVGLKK